MNKIAIILQGCDDDTRAEFVVEDKVLSMLVNVAKQINSNSDYGCQPTIHIYKDYKYYDDGTIRISGKYDIETHTYDWEATNLTKEVKNK